MSQQVHQYRRAPRRYGVGDFPLLPLLSYEDFETQTLGTTALFNGWAVGGIVFTYAGGVGFESFETSTLNNNQPPGPDYGWVNPGSGIVFFSPVITGNTFADLGSTTTMTVVTSAVSGSPFTYQWFQNGSPLSNGGEYSGVTTVTLTITGVSNTDYTTYTCQVTNLGSTLTTPTFTLSDRATDWANRVVANGGASPSAGTVTALRTFWAGLISDGIASSILCLNPIAPDSLIAALTPFVRGIGSDPWTNHNFVSADLTVNGLIGDASSKYLDTGFNALSGFTTNNSGMTIYEYTHATSSSTNNDAFGAQADNAHCMNLLTHNGPDGQCYVDNYNNTVGQGRMTTSAPGNGYSSANRTASNAASYYFANSTTTHSAIVSMTTSGGSLPNLTEYMLALNFAGSVFSSSYSNARASFAAFHLGFSAANSLKFYNRIQTLRTSFGGGFV